MEQDDLQEIKKRAEKFESQYNKVKQEFKDYIETSRKNEAQYQTEIKTKIAKKLLVVADSLDRIYRADSTVSCDIVRNYSENFKNNIDAISSQLLSASGLTPIDTKEGEQFDENIHLPIGLEYSSAHPENSVIRVIRKGYRIENNVVRPTEVIVSKPLGEVKVPGPGLWDRFLRWINPSKYRYQEIHQIIDELDGAQKEKIETLSQTIDSLRNTVMQLEEKLVSMEQTLSQRDEAFSNTDQYQENNTFEYDKNDQHL
jgi:molecular chaperone GrpE